MIKLKRLSKSFVYAFHGISRTFKEEQNFRIQTVGALIIILLAFYLQLDRVDWILIVFSLVIVMLMELINSAIERVTDVLKPRIDSHIKEIKDIMAGAVLMASVAALVFVVIVFIPYL